MEIRRLNKKALREFIDSEEFKSMPLIPITKYRALSHLTNPRAADDDVLLLMAFEDNKMAGYLGVLADFLYDGDKFYKVGWLSASGVDPNQRRKGIAGKLLHAALDAWNNQILVADWVPSSFGVYEKSGAFTTLASRTGVQANIRFNLRENFPAKTLPRRIGLAAADKFLNSFNSVRLLFALKNNNPLYEKVDGIDDESVQFMSRWKSSELFRRSEKEYAWILKYPWVLQKSSEYPKRDERFIFSSVCNEFRHEVIKIRNNRSEMIAFLMLTVRNKSLQIPYVYFQSEQVEAVAGFIYRYMYEKGIKEMVSYDSRLSEYILTNKTPFISRQKTAIPYIITKSLAEKLKESGKTIQDGDGERVFT